MVLTINRLGMSLIRMGRPSESVRFLDDVDLSLSLDSRASASQNMSSIEISAKPIVFRASYRDINLITGIANKAIQRYSDSQKSSSTTERNNDRASITEHRPLTHRQSKVAVATAPSEPLGHARMLLSKEQVRSTSPLLGALTTILS
jgi:vacuolar protein sorting-associated protein 13A/C